jgi:hypothetical protein
MRDTNMDHLAMEQTDQMSDEIAESARQYRVLSNNVSIEDVTKLSQ